MNDERNTYHAILKFAAPILLFLLFFTPNVLDPTNIAWLLHGDWGQHFLGWHAYRHSQLAFPYNHEDRLAYPTGLSIIYTDSNPLLAMPLRLISQWLPDNFQYTGPWFLACVCLQYYIAYRLVKPHAPGRWSALGGAVLLTLLPSFYNRIGHDTLFAHWLILWGFYIFFEVRDEGQKRLWWAVLLLLCGFIHPYLLFMVAAIWASDLLRLIVPQVRQKAYADLARTLGFAAATLVLPVAALWICGGMSGQSIAADGFGIYSMGLDAPFNPFRKDFPFALLRGPEAPQQTFEGFQYMGFGLLVLIGAAIYLYKKTPEAQTVRADLTRARPLMWPMIILILLALSKKIQIYGISLISLPTPHFLDGVFGILRASGRFFWPVAYLLVYLSLLTLYRARPKALAIVLPLALVLQLSDLGPFSHNIQGLTASSSNRNPFHITRSPQWSTLIKASDLVSVPPVDVHNNMDLFWEIAYRSISLNKPMSTMYAARDNTVQQAIEQADFQKLQQGQIDPKHLYVFLLPCEPAPVLRPDLRVLDGVWIIPPAAMRDLVKDIPARRTYDPSAAFVFDMGNEDSCLTDTNWAPVEQHGVWSKQKTASLALPLSHPLGQASLLTFDANSYAKPAKARVQINGVDLGVIDLTKKHKTYSLPVPAQLQGVPDLTLTFTVDQILSPAQLKRGTDTTPRGIGLFSVQFKPASK